MIPGWVIPLLVGLAAGLALGGRVLWRARSTRGLPELLFAAFALALVVGTCTMLLALGLRETIGELACFVISACGSFLLSVSIVIIYVGVWRFYRRESRLALGLAVSASLLITLGWLRLLGSGNPIDPGQATPTVLFCLLLGVAGLSWWGAESLHYYGKMRRRAAIGLADWLIADRFRMLGICSLAIAANLVLTFGSPLLLGQPAREIVVLRSLMMGIWAVVLLSGYCALLSPGWYRRSISRREPKTPASPPLS